MALKAGRVGVAPDQIDISGQIKTPSTSYTKTEVNALLAEKADAEDLDDKVDVADLTANGKQFLFAYDETTEKYGYKAGASDEFHPFEGAAGNGIVLSDPIMTGITPRDSSIEDVSGGYMLIDNIYYLHIKAKLKIDASGGHAIFDSFISAFDASYSDSFKKVIMTSGPAKCYLYKDSSNHYTVSNVSGTFNTGDLVDIVGTAF